MSKNADFETKLKELLSQYSCSTCGSPIEFGIYSTKDSVSFESKESIQTKSENLSIHPPGYPLRKHENPPNLNMVRPTDLQGDNASEVSSGSKLSGSTTPSAPRVNLRYAGNRWVSKNPCKVSSAKTPTKPKVVKLNLPVKPEIDTSCSLSPIPTPPEPHPIEIASRSSKEDQQIKLLLDAADRRASKTSRSYSQRKKNLLL